MYNRVYSRRKKKERKKGYVKQSREPAHEMIRAALTA